MYHTSYILSYHTLLYLVLYCIVSYPIIYHTSYIVHLIVSNHRIRGGGSFLSLGHNYLVDANGLKLLRERNVRLILFVKDPVKITSSCVLHWHFVGNF
jgi:hypothetical protein